MADDDDTDDGPKPAPQRDFTANPDTKSKFDKMVAANKAAKAGTQAPPPAAAAAVDPDDDDDGGEQPPKPVTTPPVAAGAPAGDPPKVEDTPQAPNPEVLAAWERINETEAALRKRQSEVEADFTTRSQTLRDREERAVKFGKGLLDDPEGALREAVIAILGEDAPEDDIEAEIVDINTQLSIKRGNFQLDPNDPNVQARKLKSDLRRFRADKRTIERTTKQQAEGSQAQSEVKQQIDEITSVINMEPAPGKPSLLKSFPWLAATPEAGKLIWDRINSHHKETGQVLGIRADGGLDLAVAAALCEAEVRKAATTTAQRYQPLLQPSSKPVKQPPAPQGDQPPSRSSAPPPQPPPLTEDRKFDPDEHRRRTTGKLKDLAAAIRAKQG